jgi:ABC-type Fe3+-citrate transport system substrate-binding protein
MRREHDGHQDEITGIAILPVARADEGRTETKQLGKKTRITVGTRTTVGERAQPRPVRLKVTSLKHLADKCSIG